MLNRIRERWLRGQQPDPEPEPEARDTYTDQLYEELSFGRRTSDRPVILPCILPDHPAEVHRHPGNSNLHRKKEVLPL